MVNVYDDISGLANRCRVLIAVTISGLESGGYDGETAVYINKLNELNEKLFETASAVIKMSDGEMIWEKVEDDDY